MLAPATGSFAGAAFSRRSGSALAMGCLWAALTAVCGADDAPRPELAVRPTDDFEITGHGDADAWNTTDWVNLNIRPDPSVDYTARVKMLYSSTGVYVLFEGSDQKLTATQTADFGMIWTEDVFEVYLWPDERHPLYLEYEISPLGYELPILVPNVDGRIMGWLPWMYGGDRAVRKKVTVQGGPQSPCAAITGWRAELKIPYALLRPLANVPPRPGTTWRGNFYRMDYDGAEMTGWDWARVEKDFHEYQKFGTLRFE